MLQFFRKYQQFFFWIITVIIVFSFSFFGTFKAVNSGTVKDPVAFEAVDGSSVTQSQFEGLVHFISTDMDDLFTLGSAWAGNFLNDGVIRKDFLETGLASQLAKAYFDSLKEDLRSRYDKEKHYRPYVHPQARFLSMESAWKYFSPDLKDSYDDFMALNSGMTAEALDARIRLYLAEKKFPSTTLRQVLRYQESQYEWINPDPYLSREDLSLFRYHTLEDWFGHRFVQLMAQFIINAAKIAERQGYVVTYEEAMAELMVHADVAFTKGQRFFGMHVPSSGAYMDELLRRLGIDRMQAAKMWRQVLLFRRLFHDVGESVCVDRLAYEKFVEYANATVTVDEYQLPPALRLSDYGALQKFQVYLQAVSRQPAADLSLPVDFKDVAEVKDSYPELVQKRYHLTFVEADKSQLQAKVGVKATWEWQLQDDNWKELQHRFPDLGAVQETTPEGRLAALDRLDSRTRYRIDAFARAAIVDAHPEWLEEALYNGEWCTTVVAIREKGGQLPFKGVEDRKRLMQQLDVASGNVQLSEDSVHYYRIEVLGRTDQEEVLTFAEANDDKTLDVIVDSQLEKYYETVRKDYRQRFRGADGRWKPFVDVKNEVADLFFAEILAAISEQDHLTGDACAARRLYRYMESVKEQIQENKEAWIKEDKKQPSGEDVLNGREPLNDQWKLVKTSQTIQRKNVDIEDMNDVFNLQEGQWSEILTPSHGALSFFQVQCRSVSNVQETVARKMDEARELLGIEAQRMLMAQLLAEIQEHHAIVIVSDEEA